MAKKFNLFETRNLLIVVVVLLIAVGAYFVLTSIPEEEDFYTAEDILTNYNQYINGDSINVKGFYIYDGGYPVIVSTLSTTEGRSSLRLDFSKLEVNETNVLRTEIKFIFTGILKYEDSSNPLSPIILEVEKIKEV